MKKAEAGREIHLVFETTDAERKRYYKEDDHIMVKIQDPTGNFLKKKIEDSVDGTYTVSFTPDIVGPHSVLITVNGQPLTGSPWSVQVSPHQYKHELTFGLCHNRPEQGIAFRSLVTTLLRSPKYISISEKTDHIAVADTDNRVQVFNADGSYLTEFGQKGNEGEIIRSLAFSKNGDLIIVGKETRISLFSESGQFIREITNVHLKNACRLSVAPDGNIIVYDMGDTKIKVFSPDGAELLQSFSADIPDDIIYHQEMFFASFPMKHVVKVYNKEGVFLYDIGSEGFGEGKLYYPHGLAIDKFNNLIVCDFGNTPLQVFTLNGQFVNTIDKRETKLLRLHSVAVSKTERVYVTDFGKNCVHVFQ